MNIQSEKLLLIEKLARIDDAGVISQIKSLLSKKEGAVIGYTVGNPITKKELIKRIEAAEERIDQGEFINQEDLEEKATDW